ncbi:MAG: hypothetical protein KOO62_09600 [candidate division Zixibacteria bacterium]|nr:hypothetical protein [candidate division Zixibacteria bacterium]
MTEVLWQYVVVIALLILAIIYLVVRYYRRRRRTEPGCSKCALNNSSLKYPTVINLDKSDKRSSKD